MASTVDRRQRDQSGREGEELTDVRTGLSGPNLALKDDWHHTCIKVSMNEFKSRFKKEKQLPI